MHLTLLVAVVVESIIIAVYDGLRKRDLELNGDTVMMFGAPVRVPPTNQTNLTGIIRVLSVLTTICHAITTWATAYTVSALVPAYRLFFLTRPDPHALVVCISILHGYYNLKGRPVAPSSSAATGELLFYLGVLFTRHIYKCWLILSFYGLWMVIYAYNEWGYDKARVRLTILLLLSLFG